MLTFRPASASGLRFTRREVPLVAASLALGLGAASPALADETAEDSDQPQPSQTIIVTGRKDDQPGLDRIATPILYTPQAISVVTREELEDRGLTNLNDALRNVAGISLGAGEGRFQGNNASLRGFSTVNDMFVDNVRDFGSYFRDTFDDQSIEVLKGPASILFGRGSTGGVIHRVSKKPVAEDFVRLDLLAGTDETLRIAADFNHDGALGEGSAVRFNAMYHEAGVQSRDFARVQRWGVAPKLIFGLGTETRLFIGFVHQSERNRPDYGVPWIPGTITAPGAPAAVDRSNFYGFTNDFLDTDVSIATLKLDHDFSEDWRARSIIRYSRADRGFRYSEAIIPRSTPRGTPLASITVTRNLFEGASTDEFFQNQTDITGEFEWGGTTHTLIFGGDIAFESPTTTLVDSFNVPSTSLTAPQTVFYDSRPNSFVRLVSRPRSTGLGLFAIDTIEFGSGWSAIVGLRWDSFRTDFTGERFTREGARTDLALDRTDRNLSYRAAVVYKPAANGSIYAGFATSFNPSGEGVESVISSSRGFALSNLNLAPETSQTFEIGTKWNLLDDKFLVTASVFRIDKDQVRVPDPDVPGFNTLGGNLVAMGERLGQNTANSFLVAPGFAVVDLNLRYQFTEDLFVRVLVNNLFDALFYEQLHPFHVIPSAGRLPRPSRRSSRRVRGLIAQGGWADGRATAGHLSAGVKVNRQLPEDDPAALEAGAVVLDALAHHPLFAAAALATRISAPLFNRYGAGETYGDHVDGAIRALTRGRMRADLSATLFLSDPETYEGGELVIAMPGGETAVKLAAGDMILYASGARHRVTRVISGTREAAVLWIQSLVRGAEQRDMLFELDQTVQALRAEDASADAVLSLTGLYHNLLRLWSEP